MQRRRGKGRDLVDIVFGWEEGRGGILAEERD